MSAESPSVGRRALSTSGRVGMFLCCGGAAAALGALFQRVSAARVDIDDLGAFNAILAVVAGVGVFGLGLQLIVIRQRLSSISVACVGGFATLMTVVAAAVSVPGQAQYRLAVSLLVGAVVATTFAGLVPRAQLLWRSSWLGLGLVSAVGAVSRLVAVVPLLAILETRILAAIAAVAIGEAVMATTAIALNARAGRPRRKSLAVTPASLRRVAPTVLVLAGLWLLTVVDTLLARTRLDSVEADSYALASTVARASFFLALLLAQLALPAFMHENGRSAWLRRAFNIVTAVISVVAVGVAAVIVAWPSSVARIVLGNDADVADIGVLRVLAIGWAVFSLIPLLTFFTVARHTRLAAVPLLVAVVSALCGLAIDSAWGMAWLMLTMALVCLLIMGVPVLERLSPITRSVLWDAAPHPLGPNADVTDVAVAMVVPFYNPGAATVIDTVGRLGATLAASGRSYRIVAVSDGSTDGSAEALRSAAIEHVTVLAMPHNRGKGAALRVGFVAATAPLVGFVDADGDLPPEQVLQLLDIAETSGADAVVGSKLHPASVLSVEQHRRLMSSVFRALVRVCFRLDLRDTQTGIKVYRGPTIAPIVAQLAEDGFAIDVEVLVAARRRGPLQIIEAPVTLIRNAPLASTVSLRRAVATARGLARIFWRDRVAMRYDRHEPIALSTGLRDGPLQTISR